MNKTFKILEQIEATAGRIDKEYIIAENQTEELKFVFETALNPFYVYGAFEFDVPGQAFRMDIPTLTELKVLRSKLLNKTYTGNTAKDELRKTLLTADETARKWLIRMFKKDLKCGASTKAINKIFKGLIPEFQIGLCDKFNDTSIFKMSKWYAEPKYDGNRAIAFIDKEYNVTIVSRNNKPVYNVDHIIEEISDICKKTKLSNVIFDGELYGSDWNESTSIIRSSVSRVDNTKIFFYIFDLIHGEEWAERITKKLVERKEEITQKLLSNIEKYKNIRVTPWYPIASLEEANKIYKAKLKDGFEGLVLKHTTSMYPFGRAKAWLKWKPVETYDVKIINWESGKPGSKYETILGAFLCELDGKLIRVGGGYTDDLRAKFWREKEQMRGKIIEVECQEKTKDGSLRFPVFLRIRDDKE